MKNVNLQQATEMLNAYNGGHFFSVTFVKRTTGEVRNMTCRKGVAKYTKGGSLSYDPKKRNLLGVWDAQCDDPAKAYRMINLNSIRQFTIDGETYKVFE